MSLQSDESSKSVRELQSWLIDQPHLPKVTDTQLMWFLHSCYFDLEVTKQTIDNYFTCRTRHSHLYDCPKDEEIDQACAMMAIMMLPKRESNGYLITMTRLIETRPEKFNLQYFNKVYTMTMNLYLKEHGSQEGYVYIFDAEKASVRHLLRLPLGDLKTILYFLQEAAPLRLKAIHVINTNAFAYAFLNVIKPFLKKELADVIIFHSNFKSLHKHIPPECLVKEYGGTLPSFRTLYETHVEEIKKNLDYFRWHDTQKTDESKKSKKSPYFYWF